MKLLHILLRKVNHYFPKLNSNKSIQKKLYLASMCIVQFNVLTAIYQIRNAAAEFINKVIPDRLTNTVRFIIPSPVNKHLRLRSFGEAYKFYNLPEVFSQCFDRYVGLTLPGK